MHDYIRLGYLGLTDSEKRVMKSIFTLSPALKESYILTGSKELEKADLVMVNVDDPNVIIQWNELLRINNLVSPMTLSAKGRTIYGVVPLGLPIRLQKLVEALANVVTEHTSFKIPEGSSKSEAPLHILVVDDSFPVRKYMEQKLTELVRLPTRFSFAESGEQAVQKFQNCTYDMVFLDVTMGGADGYKVCKVIKSEYNTYVVMLTSKKSPFDKIRGTMSGCDAYVTKPPEDQRLLDEIQKCVRRRSKMQFKHKELKGAVAH